MSEIDSKHAEPNFVGDKQNVKPMAVFATLTFLINRTRSLYIVIMNYCYMNIVFIFRSIKIVFYRNKWRHKMNLFSKIRIMYKQKMMLKNIQI